MNIAIVGSRGYVHLNKVATYVAALPPETCIVSGGAAGVDLAAEQAARSRGLSVQLFLPDWKQYGKKAGPIRNQQIVDQAEKLVAFWDGTSKGTQHSINLARKKGIPVEIYE